MNITNNTANIYTYSIKNQEKVADTTSLEENFVQDSIVLSDEAKNVLENDTKQKAVDREISKLTDKLFAIDIFESSKSTSEADQIKEEQEILLKCLQISKNLKGGGRVPATDQEYLCQKNFNMYQMALTARMQTELLDKDEESVLDEEDIKEQNGQNVTSSEEKSTEKSAQYQRTVEAIKVLSSQNNVETSEVKLW